MVYCAAYLLAVLGGNKNPQIKDVEKILQAAGCDYEVSLVKTVIVQFAGKTIREVVEYIESITQATSDDVSDGTLEGAEKVSKIRGVLNASCVVANDKEVVSVLDALRGQSIASIISDGKNKLQAALSVTLGQAPVFAAARKDCVSLWGNISANSFREMSDGAPVTQKQVEDEEDSKGLSESDPIAKAAAGLRIGIARMMFAGNRQNAIDKDDDEIIVTKTCVRIGARLRVLRTIQEDNGQRGLELAGAEAEDEGSDDDEAGRGLEIRFSPDDKEALTQIYHQICVGQEENLEEDDPMFDDEEEEEEEEDDQEMHAEMEGNRLFTADNLDQVQINEEGLANMQRIFGK